MAYQVLSGHKCLFTRSEGGAGRRCAFVAGRTGIRKDGTWYTYGWDLTKNICESARQSPRGPGGGLAKCAAFAPEGRAANGVRPSQPIQWSSEYNDSELGLVYYNYRHYNPADGRWTGRDLSTNAVSMHLYSYTCNLPLHMYDIWGNFAATATAATVGLTISAPALVGVFVAVAIVGTVVYVATKRCSACPPPTQKHGQRLDCVPPSRSHYPCKGSHIHSWVFVMHQNPTTCQCYEKKRRNSNMPLVNYVARPRTVL